ATTAVDLAFDLVRAASLAGPGRSGGSSPRVTSALATASRRVVQPTLPSPGASRSVDESPRRQISRGVRNVERARVRMEGFTTHQACKFTGCTPRQLRYWDQIALVQPSVQGTGGRPGVPRLYAFRD